MGRRKIPGEKYHRFIHLTLRPGVDDDIITLFDSIPAKKRVAWFKVLVRTGDARRINVDDLPEDDALLENLGDFLK
jgi:hypothetical protein